MDTKTRISSIYEALYNRYGPQYWWPADSALECIIGAILTQNTTWKNVEKAIGNLKQSGLISVDSLNNIKTETLAEFIRPSGYYYQKALKIKHFIDYVVTSYSGNLEHLLDEQIDTLREKLLELKGIGPETADSIILYAAKKPIFVIDAYTHRILSRHNLVPDETSYQEMQELFMDSLPEDRNIFNEYHALIVKTAKEHCTKRNPDCSSCPLQFDPHEV